MKDLDKIFIIEPYLGKPEPMMVIKKDEKQFTAIDCCSCVVTGPLKRIIRPATVEECAKAFIDNCFYAAKNYDFEPIEL